MQFTTDYRINDQDYSTVIYARDVLHAQLLILERGFGEKIALAHRSKRPTFCSEWIEQQNWRAALHSACWLGMVGAKANVVTGFELLHDQGLIHTLTHLNDRTERSFKEPTKALQFLMDLAMGEAKRLEAIVPGFTRYEGDD